MRRWWQIYVEEQLNRLPVNWDMLFLGSCTVIAVLTVLSGGHFPA